MAKTEKIAYILEQVSSWKHQAQFEPATCNLSSVHASYAQPWMLVMISSRKCSSALDDGLNSGFSCVQASAYPHNCACSWCRSIVHNELIVAVILQVRLCLAKKDYIRAQILARKVSPRAFQKQQGDSKGEIGIEGTAIEAPDEVRQALDRHGACTWTVLAE